MSDGIVVPFSKRLRPRPLELPADASPVGRPCCVMVYPAEDGWHVIECSDSGAGYLGHSRWNAELTLSNSSPYERDWA